MTTVSLFTPSLLPHETLEEHFVGAQRRALLEDMTARIDSASRSRERNHTLVVGPRGAGKTHLISLAYHRCGQLIDDGTRVQRSWLPEDPWLIYDYPSLLARIVERLEPPIELPNDHPSADECEHALRAAVEERGPVVVFVENLDQILDSIGNNGQQQFRSFLQQDASLLLAATSTSLSRDLTGPDSPFYLFFTTTQLGPFSVAEAAEMLVAAARARGDDDVAAFVEAGHANSRLGAIEHLAGGQPRMWATLSRTLTVAQIDELVSLLLERLDELTPYYQEQLRRLSPLQRRVVSALAQEDRPLNNKALAHLLAIDERTVAKTLTELKDKRWVTQINSRLRGLLKDRRLAYYELAEPMARVAFQLKESRGEPIRMVIEFLKLWFDATEMHDENGVLADGHVKAAHIELTTDGSASVARQLRGLSVSVGVPRIEALEAVDLALAALQHEDPEPFFELPSAVRGALENRAEDLRSTEGIESLRVYVHQQAHAEFGDVPSPRMAGWIDRAAQMAATASGLANLGLWRSLAWDFDAAVADLTDLERRLGSDHPNTLTSRNNLAYAYESAGRVNDAITLHEQVLADRERILGSDHPDTLSSRNNLANAYESAGRVNDAITLHEQVLADRERILGSDHPNTLASRNNL
ncbi:MAG: ATP-binding protein, partial [Sulfitobacter sp.]|nr:ATP-binding protein [Sulfitobacter sp.]